jgi:hypothetical protein
MHGIVNQAIQGLITDKYGAEKWDAIKQSCSLSIDYFISNEPYDDDITYDIIGIASEHLNIDSNVILEEFGIYWVTVTGMQKYGEIMRAGGQNFTHFVMNLPNFHNRIMLIFPKLNPPEFKVEQISEKQLILHYYSNRDGLSSFVIGLIKGIGIIYDTPIETKTILSEKQNFQHDIIEINIKN